MIQQQEATTKELRKRARSEYRRARGTVHRAMLQEARRLTEQQINQFRRELEDLRHRPPMDTTEPDHALEAKLEAMHIQAASNSARIKEELEILEGVTEEDFIRARLNPSSSSSEAIDHYLTGVYAEWESAPDWITTAFSLAGRDFDPDQFIPPDLEDELLGNPTPPYRLAVLGAGVLLQGTVDNSQPSH